MALSTPRRTQADIANFKRAQETRKRLEKCWSEDIDWTLYPAVLKNGCAQVGKALSIPPTAVLSSLIGLGSFLISPSIVHVEGTDWKEPVLIWECVCMPTGSGKSPLCAYIANILANVKEVIGDASSWQVEDATFEKMGELMSQNGGRILGMYDELTTFLTQINLYRGRGLADSHELALFLQLYNGYAWTRNTVTGEANFTMSSTNLTLGGFTQPAVARSMIELPANVEKGLSQRFIWTFPKPTYADFETLEPVDSTFSADLVNLLSKQYRDPKTKRVFHLGEDNPTFKKTYNQIQSQLRALGGMDELLCGMLSKSKGQILRVAAVLHVLFKLDEQKDPDNEMEGSDCDEIPVVILCDGIEEDEISLPALKAAIDFMASSIQHAAYISGRSTINKEVELAEADIYEQQDAPDMAGTVLLLPGKTLNVTSINKSRLFKNKGNKSGALEVLNSLEEAGLGTLIQLGKSRGTAMKYEFSKKLIPDNTEEKTLLAGKLAKFGVTLRSYCTALEQTESVSPPPSKKRKVTRESEVTEGETEGEGEELRVSNRPTNSPHKRPPPN